jgi:hypothetical protein
MLICKNLVEKHGGRVWVDSVIGQGTSFFLSQLSNSTQIPGSIIVIATWENPILEKVFGLVGISVFGSVGQEIAPPRSDRTYSRGISISNPPIMSLSLKLRLGLFSWAL